MPRKIAIEFGEPGTSNIKVVLLGKQGFLVKLSVHRNVLMDNSTFFANKLSDQEGPSMEIGDCEDVEIYVETVGLMYCKEMKQWLMKQNVSRVLRILKVRSRFLLSLYVKNTKLKHTVYLSVDSCSSAIVDISFDYLCCFLI